MREPVLPPRHIGDRPWLIVIEERARHWARRRTGSDRFWRFYVADVTADMVHHDDPSTGD